MSITEERLKTIDFTDKIYNTPPAIAVPKDSDLKGDHADDLAGKSIGVQSSTTHAAYAEADLSELRHHATTRPPTTSSSTSPAGRLDAVDGRHRRAQRLARIPTTAPAARSSARCKIVPEIHGIGTGIGVRKEDTDLKEILNKAIAAIIANGTYKKINDKYFDFNAYGG